MKLKTIEIHKSCVYYRSRIHHQKNDKVKEGNPVEEAGTLLFQLITSIDIQKGNVFGQAPITSKSHNDFFMIQLLKKC